MIVEQLARRMAAQGPEADPSHPAQRPGRTESTGCPAGTADRAINIRLATTDADLEAIYRFRYVIYVEEMHRQQKHADHAARRICDPLDACGHILGVWEQGEVVGTVRANFVRESDLGEYFEMYQVDRLPGEEQPRTSLTTRLMIHPRHRKGTLATRLARAIYRFGLERGITTDLIDCNQHLIPFFTSLGYRVHRDDLVHPEYGAVTVMKLNLTDQAHLQQIRSPFLPVLQAWIAWQNQQNNHPNP